MKSKDQIQGMTGAYAAMSMGARRALAAFAASLGGLASAAAGFPLEWSARYPADVPYEVSISTAKLARAGIPTDGRYTVSATTPQGAIALQTLAFPGRDAGTIDLRFTPPRGTTALLCLIGEGGFRHADSSAVDNIFAGALSPAAAGRWAVPDGFSMEGLPQGGLRIKATKEGKGIVSFAAALPEPLAGSPVRLELDVCSRAKLVWGGKIRIAQLDAAGRELPESAIDPRWTTHMRPPDVPTAYREAGRLHPRARSLRLDIHLHSLRTSFGADGLPLTDLAARLPSLDVTRLALRPAALLPFPKYDDRFFAPGRSGGVGDGSLALGGDRAFFFQVQSQAAWAEGHNFRDDRETFLPIRSGTVEAWFRPDWKAFGEAGRGAKGNPECVLFETFQNYRAPEHLRGRGVTFRLSYVPAKKTLRLLMTDVKSRAFSAEAAGVVLPDGRWSHVAVTWDVACEAKAFVDGRPALEMPLPGYEPENIADPKIPRPGETRAMEFYFGSSCAAARLASGTEVDPAMPFFAGEVDDLRISSGVRYPAPFTPPVGFATDGDTRALFTFDRSFDGVSGGGCGFIPGTTRALSGRLARNLRVDGRDAPYFPDDLPPALDPRNVFDTLNYPVLPSPGEFHAARTSVRRTFRLKPGDHARFTCPADAYPDFVEIANRSARPLVFPAVVNEGEVDPRSFADIRDSLFPADGPALDAHARVDRVFQYVIRSSDYFMCRTADFPAGSDEAGEARKDALMVLNAYCGFDCGPLNNLAANLFSCVAGCPAGPTGGYGHSFEQVFYDGRNRIYDLSAQKNFPAFDNETYASLGEDENEPGIHNRLGGSPSHFIRCGARGTWVEDPAYQAKIGVTLNPGETFRAWFANKGAANDLFMFLRTAPKDRLNASDGVPPWRKPYGAQTGADETRAEIFRVNRFFPQYANGFLRFEGRPSPTNPAFSHVTPTSFCYRVVSGYPVVDGTYSARLQGGAFAPLAISTDRGRTFRPLPDGPARYAVRARHEYLVRVMAPIDAVERFEAETVLVMNARTFPGRVRRGSNDLLFKAVSGGEADVTVQWRENRKPIIVQGGAYSGTLPGHERQVLAVEPGGSVTLHVEGSGARARIETEGGVTARLERGSLVVSAPAGDAPHFAAVRIIDGDAEKELTVVVAKNVRLATAADATVTGGATLTGADGSSPQRRVVLKGTKDGARFRYAPLPAGRYLIFDLNRFESQPENWPETNKKQGMPLLVTHPGTGKALNAGAPRNGCCNYYKAWYGKKGGRANWKWDFPLEPGLHYAQQLVARIDLPETDGLDFRLARQMPNGVEVAAVLVVPVPDDDFYAELLKMLCGLNCEPWRVAGKDVRAAPGRLGVIDPAGRGELRLRPTFSSCSACFGAGEELRDASLQWRRRGDAPWRDVSPLPFFPESGDYRASITGLSSGTAHEVRFRVAGKVLASGKFRTWTDEVPVARTVEIDPRDVARGTFRIAEKGSPEGWIRYVAKGGATLESSQMRTLILIDGAEHVMLEGLTLRGGGGWSANPIVVKNSRAVRIVNCELSGWGRKGVIDWTKPEFRARRIDEADRRKVVNFDAAIAIGRGSSEVVVERCYIHDPRGHANAWYLAHPAGPEAVMMHRPDHSTVLRYNDFVGSDEHRWNDAVEGEGNFSADGGFNRDADIDGNFMAFANDDCIELDGGQQNVRCLRNRFEGSYCGVSLQGCMVGPAYVCGNLFAGLGDEFGRWEQTVKTSSFDAYGHGPFASVADNIFAGAGNGIDVATPTGRFDIRRNVFCGDQKVHGADRAPHAVLADNVFGGEMPPDAMRDLPYRPVPFTLDTGRMDGLAVRGGSASPALASVTVSVGGKGYSRAFRIRKNDASGWFDVSPASGTLRSGESIALVLRLRPERMLARRKWRGAFLVRTEDGYSRPVTVYAENFDYRPPARPGPAGASSVYIDTPGADGTGLVFDAAKSRTARTFVFDVPKDGVYNFAARCEGPPSGAFPTLDVSVDGEPAYPSVLQVQPYATWTLLTRGTRKSNHLRPYPLAAGRHTLTVAPRKGWLRVASFAVTDDPGPFDPR